MRAWCLLIFVLCFGFGAPLYAAGIYEDAVRAANESMTTWMVHARGMKYIPQDAKTSIGEILPPAPNHEADLDIEHDFGPEGAISYYFMPEFLAQLGFIFSHHVAIANASDTDHDDELGEFRLLTSTLTALYQLDLMANLKPYIGGGIAMLHFYARRLGHDAEAKTLKMTVSKSNVFGGVIQLGVDYELNERFVLNFDFKKILISLNGELNGPALGTEDTGIKIVKNPMTFGMGLGYRFS